MTDIIMRKTILAGRQCLVPVDERGLEYMARVRNDRDVGVVVKQHRNSRHHRLFFAIVDFVKMHAVDDNGESLFAHVSEKGIRAAIMTLLGRCTLWRDVVNDRWFTEPDSIQYAAMGQTEFQKFFQEAVDLICQHWMPPGTVPEDVYRHLIELVDGEHALPERVA